MFFDVLNVYKFQRLNQILSFEDTSMKNQKYFCFDFLEKNRNFSEKNTPNKLICFPLNYCFFQKNIFLPFHPPNQDSDFYFVSKNINRFISYLFNVNTVKSLTNGTGVIFNLTDSQGQTAFRKFFFQIFKQ